ncbi:MAG: hypothetical protein CMJ64_24485 [Planctomycetaceae bacterium]|nr:hypothetical protein [Planctomycetaceae bacterium]
MRFAHFTPLVIILSQAIAHHVEAASPCEAVKDALSSMRAWTGDDDNGQAWKRFLKSDALAAEVAKGEQADAAQVRAILEIYSGDTPGLDVASFVSVREALVKWSSELDAGTSLLDRVRAAKGNARTLADADVAAAKGTLLANVEQLEQFLDSGPSENAEKWKEFLQWRAMQAELAKADNPSLEVLNRSLVKYRENQTGLELPQFTGVRGSLLTYMNRVLFSADEDFATKYDQHVEQLATLLEKYNENPTSEDAIQIGRALGWFERAEQIPSVVESVRGAHSHANLLVSASKRLVGAGIEDTVDRTQGIQDVILGTSIRGTARLQGSIGLELVPSPERAAFDITLQGTAVSNNVGTNRGVTIYTTGHTNVTATKRIYVGENGMTSDAATGSAATSSTIDCIAAKLSIVRKIAWKQALSKKGQAERIASGRAAGRIAGEVDASAAEIIAESNENLDTKVRSPLIRREGLPSLNFSTTAEHLVISLLHATRFQIAAPGPAPAFEGEYDLKARAHQSVVANLSESILGGVKLTDERIVELYEEAEREVPEDLQLKDDSEPWAITFARSQPIAVEFANGGVQVTVRCQTLHRGAEYDRVNLSTVDENDRRFNPEIQISREYDVTTPNGGLQLVAKGDLNIDFVAPGGKLLTKYGLVHTSAKSLLTKKLGAMLTDKLPKEENDGFVLPGDWEKAGKLKARHAQVENGWLLVGLEQSKTDAGPNVAQNEQQPQPEQTAIVAP